MFVNEFQKTQARFPRGSRVVSPGNPVRFGIVKGYTLHPRGLIVDVEEVTQLPHCRPRITYRETITHAALWHSAENWPDSGLTTEGGEA